MKNSSLLSPGLNFFLITFSVFFISALSTSAQYPRNVLIENFGGFYHQPQGKVVNWIDSLSEKFPGDVIPICYYVTPCLAGCDPEDPLSLHKTAAIDSRSFYYPYHVAPATDVYVDGIYGFLPWALGWSSPIPPCSDSTILQRALVPSPLSINVQHTFNSTYDTMHIHVEITAAANFIGGTNSKLRVVPIEEYIQFPEPIGSFNYHVSRIPRVVRDMTPDQIGVYVGTINAGSTSSYDFNWAVNNVYDLNTLRAVAFVQDDPTMEVIQAGQSQFVAIPIADCSVSFSKKYYCPQNGNNVYPEIKISNEGVFTIHQLNIDYGIYGGNMYNTTWTGSMLPGTSMILALNFPLLPPGSSILEVNVQSDLPYDTRPHNNLLHFEPAAHENTLQYMTMYVPGQVYYPFTEDFESGTYPPFGWNIETTGSEDAWALSPHGGFLASPNLILAPLGLMFKYHPWNERTSIVTPAIDFTNAISPVVSFDLAYKCKNYGGVQTDYDTLNIWASNDCGESWQLIYRKDESQITTALPCSMTNMWTPSSAAEWMTDTVSILQFVGINSVLLKFEAISGEGQSLYLDNINVAEGMVTGIHNANAVAEIMMYPNPSTGIVNISVPQEEELSDPQFRLIDVTGRIVYEVSDIENQKSGFSVDLGVLESGMYTAEIIDHNTSIFRKQFIKE